MPSIFMTGTKNRLLTTLGIPYGFIVVEDCNSATVYSRKSGEDVLQKAVEEKLVTAEEAAEMGRQMDEAGLAADDEGLFARILEFQVPEGFAPTLKFDICQNSDCPPLPHGYITGVKGNNLLGGIRSKVGGFLVCSALTRAEKAVHPLDAVQCLQQILKTNLARDEDEFQAQFKALPEDARGRIARRSLLASLLDQTPPEIVMMGIPLPGLHV